MYGKSDLLRSFRIGKPWLMVCGIITTLLLLRIFGCGTTTRPEEAADKAASSEAAAALVVQATPLQVRTIAETVSGLGRCEALPERIASLTSAVEGRVQKLVVKRGDSVTHGQPVVQLDPRIAQANLAEKTAGRDGLKASLQLLQAPPRPEDLKNQELTIQQSKLAHDRALAAADRLRPLTAKGEISQAQMYEAEVAASQAQLQRDAAEAQLRAMKLGPRSEAVAESQARIATADATVESAQAQLELHTITAPVDGVLDSITCQLGQTIGTGATIGQIVDTHQLLVIVWLSPRDISRILIGQTASVISDMNQAGAYSSSGEAESQDAEKLSGKVTFVGRVADPQTGNLPVQILIDNQDGQLVIGQMVSVDIKVKEKTEVLAVPLAALFDVGEGYVLNIIRDGKSVRAQPKLGIRDKKWAELYGTDLKEPLKAGEMAIVEGGYNLPDGTEVKVAPIEAEQAPAPNQNEPAARTTSATTTARGTP